MKYNKNATTTICIIQRANPYESVMPGIIINGFEKENSNIIIDKIVKILNPLFVYFSSKKNTNPAIIVGITLAIIIGSTDIGILGPTKISSVIIAAF